MFWIIMTVVSYLSYNLAIWLCLGKGGLLAIGLANVLGGAIIALVFQSQITGKGRPKWAVSGIGAVGIILIVIGLRISHSIFPDISLSLEAVYNTFAITSWGMFLALNRFWPQSFQERPNKFDAICHLLMFNFVIGRFWNYGFQYIPTSAIWGVIPAVMGYALFNISIKLAKGHRATNVMMNLLAGGGLGIIALLTGDASGTIQLTLSFWGGFLLGGAAIVGIVTCLGFAYGHFSDKASLVPPLIYDGILIGSPILSLVVYQSNLPFWAVWTGVGMVFVTLVRYYYHYR